MRIMINGFGRVGRTILRQLLTTRTQTGIEVVAINDIAPLDMCAYLFAYDSVFGPYPGDVEATEGALVVDDVSIPFMKLNEISAMDLSNVELVLECTGVARTSDIATRGLTAGAKAVLISGPVTRS